MADVLSDVLRAVRLRGTVYFRAHFRAPWGMSLGQKDVAVFHAVTAGRCWLRGPGGTLELAAGEVVLLPHGAPHTLLSAPGAAALPAPELLANPLAVDGADAAFGGTGETTTLVCGHYEAAANHPLFDNLPEVVRVAIDDQTFSAMTDLVVSEANRGEAGAAVVVDRMAEGLLVKTLRSYAAQVDVGFVAALADSAIGGALEAFHADPADAWTVEALARAGGVSRAVFSARFTDRIGASPMQYVVRWRMQRARELLVTTESTLATIASDVGYESEFAFAKAFKRVFGIAPGAARRASRSA